MNKIEYLWNPMIICDDCLEEMRMDVDEAVMITDSTITLNVIGNCEQCLIKELSEEGMLHNLNTLSEQMEYGEPRKQYG